ncbi:hypothetical protein [Embleya sp. NPDC020630]|uniref:hypothetical protein n=1 Tax=Embleya sp. NPDC020630 TaxID=3363979 RepID=UPI00379CB624
MSWSWEYHPDEQTVVGGAPEAFIAQVETRAEEIVRAAEALYLDGTTYQGPNPPMGTAYPESGMFRYLIVVRSESVLVLQVTYLPA